MKLIIYTDGASRGNPGPAAYGFTIQDETGHYLTKVGEYIGETTNNVAEYTAALEALKQVKKLESRIMNYESGRHKIQIELFADSRLVAEQLSGRYKIKSAHLKPIIVEIQKIAIELGGVIYNHIPRSQNTLADKLANQALDSR